METTARSQPFAGGDFSQYGHICAFFNSTAEQRQVLGPFVTNGFGRGDKACHLVDPDLRDTWPAGPSWNPAR